MVEEKLIPQWLMTYICAHCGGFAFADEKAVDVLDSGTTLTCNLCDQPTIVDLFTPAERARMYKQAKFYEELFGLLGSLPAPDQAGED